eukprot:Sspe_Gene.87046::Locus_57929_Transcript_1_1_Confidence_1.000_Length_1344::g.87046::m.87046
MVGLWSVPSPTERQPIGEAVEVAADESWRVPPCKHNNWDDVRQRKGVKILRCRECNAKWKWARGARRGDPGLERCIDSLNGRCPLSGAECPLLHIRRQKMPLAERISAFGEKVLEGISEEEKRKALAESARSQEARVGHGGLSSTSSETPSSEEPEMLQIVNGLNQAIQFLEGTVVSPVPSLEGLALECAHYPLAASGPPTPRGEAPTHHKAGPPLPLELRRRANTPPPLETPPEDPVVTVIDVQIPSTITFGIQAAWELLGAIASDVKWEVHTQKNNSVGMVPRPRASTDKIWYLGTFTTFEECMQKAEEKGCYAFTWHSRSCPRQQWRLQGYGQPVPTANSINGVVSEHWDPAICSGTISARLVVSGEGGARQYGSFKVLDPPRQRSPVSLPYECLLRSAMEAP